MKDATMKESWLVQRLKKPHGPIFGMKDNPFSFGGGLHNGGLSGEAMDLLRGIFSFDYMGSSEFEWGAVPTAMRGIASCTNLTADVIDVDLGTVPAGWRAPKDTPARIAGTAPVYVLAPEPMLREVAKRIRKFATGKAHTKELVRLDSALRPVENWDTDTCGWLELDNGYFFFTDRDMWAATCALFAVEVPAAEAVTA